MINLVIWILLAIMYGPIFYTLYQFRWDKVDYTHAYFILPVALWLTFRKRTHIKELFRNNEFTKTHLGLPLLAFGIVMFIFGWRQDYLFLSTLSLIPVLFGIVIYLYGIKMTKTLTFPILYLLLLVPPPFGILDSITLPMRHAASFSTESILSFVGYPIAREGLELIIGYHRIAVGEPYIV